MTGIFLIRCGRFDCKDIGVAPQNLPSSFYCTQIHSCHEFCGYEGKATRSFLKDVEDVCVFDQSGLKMTRV